MNALASLAVATIAMTLAPVTSSGAAPSPRQVGDITDVTGAAGNFKTLLAAAKAAGVLDEWTAKGPITLLAPTDKAFAALGADTIRNLLQPENRSTLARILHHHVIAGTLSSSDALKAGKATTVAGVEITFALKGGRLQVNGEINITANDMKASNGVVHIIDQVLIPPAMKPKGRLVIGFFSEAPGEELANYLGVDPTTCLLVSSVTKGSAAEKGGLRPYDLITEINGKPVTSKAIGEAKESAGFEGQVRLTILRRGKEMTLALSVGVEED